MNPNGDVLSHFQSNLALVLACRPASATVVCSPLFLTRASKAGKLESLCVIVWLVCIVLLKVRDDSLLRIGERDSMPKQQSFEFNIFFYYFNPKSCY